MIENFGIEINYGQNIGYLGSPRYGIFNPIGQITPLQELLKYTSAMWYPDMASGVRRTPLEPRTLPSGVSNGMYQQNVSVDFLLTSNLANSYITTQTLVDLVRFPKTAFVNSSTWSASTVIDGAVFVNGSEEIAIGSVDSLASIGKHYKDASNIHFVVAKGAYANLADAQTRFPSQLTRYQLATPIDTLNTPFNNQITDLSGVVGKNLFDQMATLRGYANNSSGQIVPNSLWAVTDFIPCVANQEFYKTNFGGDTGFYDANKVLLQGATYSGNRSFSVPNNPAIKFMRLNLLLTNLSITMLNEGATPLPYEPYGKANGLLTNFAGTTADGYVVDTAPNGKQVIGIKGEGTDSVIVLPSNAPSIDIQGTGPFAYACVFKTTATLKADNAFFAFSDGVNVENLILTTTASTYMTCRVARNYADLTGSGALQANTWYKMLFYRIGGRLKFRLLSAERYNQLNSSNILASPHKRILGRASNAEGTTHANLNQYPVFAQIIINGTFDEAKLIADWDKFCAKEYGL